MDDDGISQAAARIDRRDVVVLGNGEIDARRRRADSRNHRGHIVHRIRACSTSRNSGYLFCKAITDTRAEPLFRTRSLSFASASADGPFSLSGGIGVKVPVLFP